MLKSYVMVIAAFGKQNSTNMTHGSNIIILTKTANGQSMRKTIVAKYTNCQTLAAKSGKKNGRCTMTLY